MNTNWSRCGLVLLAFVSIGFGQARAAAPILPVDWRSALISSGFESGEVVPIDAPAPVGAAYRISTASVAENQWDRRLLGLGQAAAKAGEVGLLRLQLRTVGMSGRPGYLKFVVESVVQPYVKSVEWSIKVGPEWQVYEVPFRFNESYLSGLYTVQFWFPHAPQTIEMGGLSLEQHGAVSFSSLKLAQYPYAGHGPGAAWRAQAEKRIEQIRKGDVTVVVRDSSGRPVPNAPVRLRMKRHAFAFGGAIRADWLRSGTADGEQYRRRTLSLFNAGVLENDLKWFEWESDKTRALLGLAWLKTNGIREVRGHTILWPDWPHMPIDVSKQSGDPDAVRARVNKRIDEAVASARGLVTEWDVANEPATANVLARVLGAGEMAKWFHQTRAKDPVPRLFVNEYGVIDDGGENIPKQNRYAAVIEDLMASGAPLDGIGLQAHIGDHLTSPETLLSVLDRYGAYGKNLKITEFDVAGDNEQTQADYTRDFLIAAFSHPSVSGVYLWGFWEGSHYRPEAALYRKDWSARPAADVWNNLLYKDWWSDVQGVTDANGAFRARVFYGDYDVESSIAGQAVTQSLNYSPATGETVALGNFEIGPLSPLHVQNGASLKPGALAAGEQLLIRTRDFGPEPAVTAKANTAGLLPSSLGGRQVLLNGIAAPILSVSADAIHCVVPSGLGPIATVQLNLFGKPSNTIYLPVAEAMPALVASGSTVGGLRAVTLFDEAGAALTRPARAGDTITIHVTGVAPVASIDLRQAAPAPEPIRRLVRVMLGSSIVNPASATWIRPGITEVRFEIPRDYAPGRSAIRVEADGQVSPDDVFLTTE